MKTLLATTLLVSVSFGGSVYAQDSGEDLYQVYCTQCHGVTGNGKGVNAAHLSVAPRNHGDRAEMSARTDDELAKVIREGGTSINKSNLMPAWGGNLSDEEISALVAFLRTLCCEDTE